MTCPLFYYSPMPAPRPSIPLRPFTSQWPSTPFMGLGLVYGPLFRLQSFTFSIALCPTLWLSTPLRPSTLAPSHGSPHRLQPFVPSTALCLLYGSLSPLRRSVSSLAPCPLLRPSVPLYGPPSPSSALCPLLWPSIPSTTLCPLYGPFVP
jgi:hypothetical protein